MECAKAVDLERVLGKGFLEKMAGWRFGRGRENKGGVLLQFEGCNGIGQRKLAGLRLYLGMEEQFPEEPKGLKVPATPERSWEAPERGFRKRAPGLASGLC